MKRFAELVDRLAATARPDRKRALLADYLRRVPDPDRGYALAALLGVLELRRVRPALLRGLIAERTDAELFTLSHDYVGDLAETVALIWPASEGAGGRVALSSVVDTLRATGRTELPTQLAAWLDQMPASERWALLRLVSGRLSVGVPARLARQALADVGGVEVAAIEEVWHAMTPPYAALFAWLDGTAPRPAGPAVAPFRAMMAATALDPDDLDRLDPADYQAEWCWHGLRVQLAAEAGTVRLYTQDGDDVSGAFPDLMAAAAFDAVLDGDLLVMRNGVVAAPDELQRRLKRQQVSRDLLDDCPVHLRVRDLLIDAGDDLRALPLRDRWRRLEAWYARHRPVGIDLSPRLAFDDWTTLAALHAGDAPAGTDGIMLRRRDGAYTASDRCGLWLKWPRTPNRIDTVLLYAERGPGGRAAPCTGCTVGLWRADTLVPVGKATLDLDAAEQARIDAWVREHAGDRFGPVTQVAPELVLEIAFDGVARSARRKSGLALRRPRVVRARWDTPAAEAGHIDVLEAIVAG